MVGERLVGPRSRRLMGAVAVGVLVGSVGAAPHLAPAALLPLSLVSMVAAGFIAHRLFRLARQRLGRWAATLLFVGAGGLAAASVGIQWTGLAGTILPCRRNWGWLPSYLLRSSPTRSDVVRHGGIRIKVCYGSPRSRGRSMIGGPPVAFGQLWRTGANEPTTIRASGPITIAGVAVPTGLASVYSVPGPETWEIVINGSTTQWGIESEYPVAAELGRRVVRRQSLSERVEALTLRFETAGGEGQGPELVLAWETTEVRIPIALPAGPSREIPRQNPRAN